jgi:hypothetical protein
MNDRSRPHWGDLRDAGGQSEITVDQPVDLQALTVEKRRIWLDGYQWGRVGGLEDGYTRGYQACDAEIASLQREAARVVNLMAGIPPHRDAQERRRTPEKAAADRYARNAARWPQEASA